MAYDLSRARAAATGAPVPASALPSSVEINRPARPTNEEFLAALPPHKNPDPAPAVAAREELAAIAEAVPDVPARPRRGRPRKAAPAPETTPAWTLTEEAEALATAAQTLRDTADRLIRDLDHRIATLLAARGEQP